jgi:hypothetical protein
MGGSNWDPGDYARYSSSIKSKSREAVFSNRKIDKKLDPKNIEVRESRDSKENPNSNAIIVGMDVTGSMGSLLDAMIRKLDVLVEEILKRKPVVDPHICFMGIGDAECDTAPLQVTQFEPDIKIAKQLAQIWIEQGGGGNHHESYTMPWVFAAKKTEIDCFDKRKKKGYIFTIGDEEVPPKVYSSHLSSITNIKSKDLPAKEAYELVSKKYEVFHIMVEQGDYFRNHGSNVKNSWLPVLGQHAILLSDHTKLPEVIVSTIQANEGQAYDEIVASWTDSSVKESVRKAINFRKL